MNEKTKLPRTSQVDEQSALKALDGSESLLQDLARMFCEDAPVALEKLEAAVQSNEAMAARRAAHNIKGLAATFFAQPTIELAQQLEQDAAEGQLESLKSGGVEKLDIAIHELAAELKARGWVP